jgi:two-component system OmpR family sensor kinase
VSSFALGGAVATLLASGLGYLLATVGLAPVEAMRRQAGEVSLLRPDQRLPLPAARDEIRRLGETLNEMLARLRDAFERESRFVADASHELRTPIAIIKTELESALREAGAGSPAGISLVAAAEECDRLIQLTDDLLVIARAADGQLPIRPEPTGVADLLDGVRDRFTDRATRRGRAIRTTAAPHLRVHADPVRLRQAMANLVENALRHGVGDVSLAARNSGEFLEIDVSDEGPGFPPDISERAFERFSRGDRARTGDGVGLGLAIVAAIAAAHGGSAEIASGAPTTLRLRLPASG